MSDIDVSELLPKTWRDLLVRASQVGKPESMQRLRAIELATDQVKQAHPEFFRPEALNTVNERIAREGWAWISAKI